MKRRRYDETAAVLVLCSLAVTTLHEVCGGGGGGRKAVRATLILIPLLGLQYTIFPLRPQSGSPLEEAYLVTSAVVTSFQVTTPTSAIYDRMSHLATII